MGSLRFFLSFLLSLLTLCGVFGAPDRDQTVIRGSVGPYDKLLYSEKVDVPKTILTVHSRNVAYPPHSTAPSSYISCIKVLDQLRTGKNAYVDISKGGVGQNHATVSLKSKRGHPIRYVVEIYGR